MPRSLVLGASGAIGSFLLPRLCADGHDVIAVSRVTRASDDPRLRWVVGDLDANMPQLPVVDTIFSCGPLDAATRWFAAAESIGSPRVIAFGSMSVESKRDSIDRAERALAARLEHAERGLIDAATARGCAWTVLRPTLIYGAGSDHSLSPLARFAARWHLLPRLSAARGLRQPVHADDLAAACCAVLARPLTGGRIYALGGGERIAFAKMIERLRVSVPTFVLPLPVPLFALGSLARLAATFGLPTVDAAVVDRLCQDLIADNSVARADFGWSPRGFRPDAATWDAPSSR